MRPCSSKRGFGIKKSVLNLICRLLRKDHVLIITVLDGFSDLLFLKFVDAVLRAITEYVFL